MLSYRCGNVAELDCVVADPAGALDRTTGAMPLSLLNTPAEGWTHLWCDALNHLNDPAGVAETVRTSGELYLAVRTLPQFWLGGDYDAALSAMSRAWVHQEIAYGRLDRAALEKFVGLCCARYQSQTHGKEWKGNPADLEGPKLLTRLIGKRVTAAATHAGSAQAACELYARVNKIPGAPAMVTAAAEVSDEACAASLAAFYDALEAKQLRDVAADNLAALKRDASLAWCVVKSYANSNVFDRSDMYVCAVGALGAACGVAVTDPLAAYKGKFFKTRGKPTNTDGTLRYTHADVDLDALNANHALLRACWEALLPMESFGDVPAAVRGVGPADKAIVDWSAYPPGLATLGLGPVPVSGLKEGKMKLGTFFGVDFTAEGPPPADGYYSRGEVKGVEGEGLEEPPAGSIPGAYTSESFGKHFAGFHPMCRWNVSMAEVEAKAKADEDFTRTIENLWTAWLKDHDEDGSKTISLRELRQFAELTECPSKDGYMQSLHDWASSALTDGTLETAFKEVDTDGSGELEFEEFKQMLWEDQ